jgi:uncharacterized protein YrrD
MLHRLEQLIGLPIEASDGEIGSIRDIYFDDHHWAVRYLIVETAVPLIRRQVLISPISVAGIDWPEHRVRVELSRQQIEASPPIETDKPVSRQNEAALFDYYAYPYYWGGPSRWGRTPNPVSRALSRPHEFGGLPEDPALAMPDDPRLRSCKEVTGYRLLATDGSIGLLEDFLFDTESWAIGYVVINASEASHDGHLVIPPEWIKGVNWEEKTVTVSVARQAVLNAPQYNPSLNFSAAVEVNAQPR